MDKILFLTDEVNVLLDKMEDPVERLALRIINDGGSNIHSVLKELKYVTGKNVDILYKTLAGLEKKGFVRRANG